MDADYFTEATTPKDVESTISAKDSQVEIAKQSERTNKGANRYEHYPLKVTPDTFVDTKVADFLVNDDYEVSELLKTVYGHSRRVCTTL